MSRFILKVLREATEPVTPHDVARRLMTGRGQDAGQPPCGASHEAGWDGVRKTGATRNGAIGAGGWKGSDVADGELTKWECRWLG